MNVDGRRFSNENAGYSEQALKVYRQPGNVAWAIWDERSDAIAMQQLSHREAKEAGAIKRCDSLEAIARTVGCDPQALAQTFADVAAAQRGEKKEEFGRDFTRKSLNCAAAGFCVQLALLDLTLWALAYGASGPRGVQWKLESRNRTKHDAIL